MAAYFNKCEDKLGFVPNVLKAYTFDMAKLSAFVAMYNDLMLAPSGLSKLEREMIAVAVSSHNRCYYCLVAHGAAVRQLSGDPLLGELMVMNYRAARLSRRERAMLDFAVKLTAEPWSVEEDDREALRRAGFTDRDIWDIARGRRLLQHVEPRGLATDMRPNSVYHGQRERCRRVRNVNRAGYRNMQSDCFIISFRITTGRLTMRAGFCELGSRRRPRRAPRRAGLWPRPPAKLSPSRYSDDVLQRSAVHRLDAVEPSNSK